MQNQEPDNVENLSGADAVKKLQELVNAQPMCLFSSKLTQIPISTRPMSTQKADDAGHLWFFSGKSSEKNMHIKADPYVQLFYANTSSSEYMSICGRAEIIVDAAKAEELWTPLAKAWFQGGPTDPELTLIKVSPEQAYYWDTKSNKMVSMMKILISTVTGNKNDDGVQGKLTV